jgi:C4-type Zn-finger protein
LDLTLRWKCPSCETHRLESFDQVPIVYAGNTDGIVFYCDNCGFESEDRMYSVKYIDVDFIDIELSDKYELRAYRYTLEEIKD